jgi:hypothetical protein
MGALWDQRRGATRVKTANPANEITQPATIVLAGQDKSFAVAVIFVIAQPPA